MTTDTEKKNDSTEAEKITALELPEALSEEDRARLPMFEGMMKVGVMYGRKKSKVHPKMQQYLYAIRNGISIFDVTRTVDCLTKAKTALREVVQTGGKILVVATQPAAQDLAKAFAEKFGQYYVVSRWLGGTLTNWKTISARVEHFKKLKSDRASGKLEQYTKKERLLIDREIEKMALLFDGVEAMKELPKMMLIINTEVHETALREARRMHVPIAAFMNSDTNPELVTFPIPGNSNARASIAWVLNELDGVLKGAEEKAVEQKTIVEESKIEK